jgi:exopolysaccharide biosynthesis polyprenyl glycosylphosphotransferase
VLGKLTGPLGLFLIVADAATMLLCFLAAFLLKKHVLFADPALALDPYLALLAIEAPFVLAVLTLSGLYSSRTLLAGLDLQAGAILKASLFAFVVFVLVSFYVQMFSYSRLVFAFFFLLLPPGLLLPRLALLAANRVLGRPPAGVRRLLVFGDPAHLPELAGRFASSPYCRFELLGTAGGGDRPHAEDLDRIEQGRIGGVVVDLPFAKAEAIAEVVSRAEREGVSVYMTGRTLPVTMLRFAEETVGGEPIIALRPLGLPVWGRIVKRLLDTLVAGAGLLLLAVPMLAVALLVKLTSRGPVLYAQRRVGLDGREFTMYKFRTMRTDAEEETGPVWAQPDDARCTGLGRLLRATNTDEVPQLWNVLRGQMSLVGPRPERPEFVRRFKAVIDRYPHKHWVKPGITGWAQVHGWRGTTRLDERIRHDLHYIEHWSLGLDLKILLMTPFLGRKMAEPPAPSPRPGDAPDEGRPPSSGATAAVAGADPTDGRTADVPAAPGAAGETPSHGAT